MKILINNKIPQGRAAIQIKFQIVKFITKNLDYGCLIVKIYGILNFFPICRF